MALATKFLKCIQSKWLFTTFTEVVQGLPFTILVENLSLGRKSLAFLQLLIEILCSELSIFNSKNMSMKYYFTACYVMQLYHHQTTKYR